jgi:hypothetical protein
LKLSSFAFASGEILLIVGLVKRNSRRSRAENGEPGKVACGGPFVPYAIYDYLAGAHELEATVQAVRQILATEKVDRAHFCRLLRERFDQLIAALDEPEVE